MTVTALIATYQRVTNVLGDVRNAKKMSVSNVGVLIIIINIATGVTVDWNFFNNNTQKKISFKPIPP